MRYAICNETFVDWTVERGLQFAAECGYTGVEIAPFTLNEDAAQITSAQRAQVRQVAQQAGLEIVGLHWLLAKTTGLYLTSPDRATRTRTIDYLHVLIDLCHDLGGSVMVFGSPQQRVLLPEVTLEAATDYAVEVFEGIAPRLESAGITLTIEPLSPTFGQFLNTAAEGEAIIARVGSRNVRLHLDCIAMNTESESIPDLLRKHRQSLAHFHANDPNMQGPGMGDLDFKPILSTLKEIDYRGWISVEVFDYAPGPERLAKESIDYLRRVEGTI